MNDKEKADDWFKKWLPKQPDKKKSSFSPKYILLLGCLGVALMLLSQFLQPENDDAMPTTNEADSNEDGEEDTAPVFGRKVEENSMADYEMRYENQLREALQEIVGVNNVSIVVNLAESEKQVYEKNVKRGRQETNETDREGGSRQVEDTQEEENVVITRNGDQDEPLVISKEKPAVAGVLVVAEGVENVQVKAWVVEAVSRVLDVAPHRVSVMPKKMKEE
ncbi:stage III sporulation protein AG [Shouchella clausii]|uniref:Stage III sporulation protein AG n=1 Tax=Shouchella clausii TaxID=79880 RepID=A0A268P3S1_SHOCL|nr:stage III sporulation protein AG [Shouchella clausii]MDO7267460.1 stage III sporulation protein AG [Shouchella clausii]MDO7287586.1 stage III sporulation protein AG [Shouchella clausii]PAE90367.1 stage III sporulation protein AG [Shouchella clausii]